MQCSSMLMATSSTLMRGVMSFWSMTLSVPRGLYRKITTRTSPPKKSLFESETQWDSVVSESYSYPKHYRFPGKATTVIQTKTGSSVSTTGSFYNNTGASSPTSTLPNTSAESTQSQKMKE